LKRITRGLVFFVGSTLTLADIAAFAVLADFIKPVYPDVFKKFSNLNGLLDRVAASPNIKAYLHSDRRPKAALPASILPPAVGNILGNQ